MNRTLVLTSPPKKVPSRDSSVQPLHTSLRIAMERTGWTQEALAAFWRAKWGSCERTRVTKWVSGVRSIPSHVINDLPQDLRAMLAVVECEASGGVAMLPTSDRDLQRLVLQLCAALQTAAPGGAR